MENRNNDNMITFMGSNDAMKQFMLSSLNSCNIVISHYDFVINDISSQITNPELEATKGPVLDFLKNMRGEWVACRDDVQRQLEKSEGNR